MKIQDTMRQWHSPSKVVFSDVCDENCTRLILRLARRHVAKRDSLMPSKMMVVGMPNVGKSSLLNALRWKSRHCRKVAQPGFQPGITRKLGTEVKIIEGGELKDSVYISRRYHKVAQTGDQPGVTRSLSTEVKIIEGANLKDSVYMVDTPGVFIPYVPNAESMLKLALCGCVKDSVISPTILADYLLYCLNKEDPELYSRYHPPTNDVDEFLTGVAQKAGLFRRGKKGGTLNEEAAALWIIRKWRDGDLGKFVLDDVSLANFEQERQNGLAVLRTSVNQATKTDKRLRLSAEGEARKKRKRS